jgi:hypothetical protein
MQPSIQKTFISVLAVLSLAVSAIHAADGKKTDTGTGTITVTVIPGTNWKNKRSPQIAIWIEKQDNTYVKTLFVSQRAGKKNWIFGPEEGRPESLPVWYHTAGLSAAKTGKTDTAETAKADTDAVTAATPAGKTQIRESTGLPAGDTYVIKIEVNHSFDYNEYWPKSAVRGSPAYSGVNGQPSVIYTAILNTRTDTVDVSFTPSGTGSIDGSDGTVHNNLNTLTSALSIIESAKAEWKAR